MANKIQNYINHVALILDRSVSMRRLKEVVIKVADAQVKQMAKDSVDLHQETRVSIYLFGDTVECLVYDMDVMRLPNIADHYTIDGNTALIDALVLGIKDLKKTPEIYADHSFLVYLVTDGEENNSSYDNRVLLPSLIQTCKDNWTLACFVPHERAAGYVKNLGIPAGNIRIWETTEAGLKDVGVTMAASTSSYMRARASGQRATKNLFQMDVNKLTSTAVQQNLVPLQAGEYELLSVHQDAVIQPFVESWTKLPYRKGSAYYQLTKPEKVQNHKQICVQHKLNGKVYGGGNARQILGLPDHEVKVSPASSPDFDIFVQSQSVNRKLVGGSKLIVLK